MTPHTVTAMYSTRQDAETAAAAIRQDMPDEHAAFDQRPGDQPVAVAAVVIGLAAHERGRRAPAQRDQLIEPALKVGRGRDLRIVRQCAILWWSL